MPAGGQIKGRAMRCCSGTAGRPPNLLRSWGRVSMAKLSIRRQRLHRLLSATLALGLLGGTAACTPRIDQRGNKPDEDQVVQINPGVDDKIRVAELIGTPSTISTFDDRTWYYISKRTETIGFLDPQVTDQQVLAVTFDADGIVDSMRLYGQEDGRTIAYVDRVTPTEGKDLTVIQQLFGNLGRFNPEGDDAN
jgi:outer membrane protein assembly factor BamE (lipoprotein component of BamABCDE complex)